MSHGQVDGYGLIFKTVQTPTSAMSNPLDDRASMLLVDDDVVFCQVLSRAMEKRGYVVSVAHSVEKAIPIAKDIAPEYAVVDLKMNGASGLELVQVLHELDANTRIVMLTGYASIATAVEAVKLGATQYLAKPANADEIIAAFGHVPSPKVKVKDQVTTVERLEWEYINRVLHENEGNVSVTARVLKMHRRTLQRKLSRNQPE